MLTNFHTQQSTLLNWRFARRAERARGSPPATSGPPAIPVLELDQISDLRFRVGSNRERPAPEYADSRRAAAGPEIVQSIFFLINRTVPRNRTILYYTILTILYYTILYYTILHRLTNEPSCRSRPRRTGSDQPSMLVFLTLSHFFKISRSDAETN